MESAEPLRLDNPGIVNLTHFAKGNATNRLATVALVDMAGTAHPVQSRHYIFSVRQRDDYRLEKGGQGLGCCCT